MSIPEVKHDTNKDGNPVHLLPLSLSLPYPALILQVVLQRVKRQLYACFSPAKKTTSSQISVSEDLQVGDFAVLECTARMY
jgi:hypothetical protein